jgi:hypothetical protein
MAGWQKLIGYLVSTTGSYTVCFFVAGLAPLRGFLALLVLWGPVQAPTASLPRPGPLEAPAALDGPPDERIVAAAADERLRQA